MILLEEVFSKLVSFLNKEKLEYIIIGGIAVGVLGEPRVTGDIDVDILLEKNDVADFLEKIKKSGFKTNKQKSIERAKKTNIFQIDYKDYHVDFIIASIELEKEAFRRKKAITLHGVKAFFPTPEDLILLKIIPGRPKDLIDAENVAIRNKGKLDTRYLKNWAQRLSDETEDMRIYNNLQKLLNLK
jgi:hypothetical protein